MKRALMLMVSVFLFSCVRAEKDQAATKVTLNIPAHFGQKAVKPSASTGSEPSTLTDINCFATLVSGPEARMSRNTCFYKNSQTTFRVGKVFGGFYQTAVAGSAMTFEVPNGHDRVIRLVGLKVGNFSSSGYTGQHICENLMKKEFEEYLSDPYVLAEESGIVMKGEDVTLEMTATLNPNYRVGDCQGPDFPNTTIPAPGSGSGVPYKFGVAFQDNLGTGAKALSMETCVGLRVQVQDINGDRADSSVFPQGGITGKISTSFLGSPIGTFYASDWDTACSPGSELAMPGSGDLTVAFEKAGVAFSDFVMFFRPSWPLPPANAEIRITDVSSTGLQLGVMPFLTSNSTSTPPVSYAIYDLYNNKSTLSSKSVAMANTVRADECRPAALQFVNGSGVPSSLHLVSGTYNPIIVTPSTSGVQFYSSAGACYSGGSSTSVFEVVPTPYTSYGSINFYYKVSSTSTPPVFSFGVSSPGMDMSPIYSGDLSSGSNFWKWEN